MPPMRMAHPGHVPTSRFAPPRRPKLRSSCDGCGAAKVKCDRIHPSCSRCQGMGIECIYGVSRPMGKPPQAKRRAAGAAPGLPTNALLSQNSNPDSPGPQFGQFDSNSDCSITLNAPQSFTTYTMTDDMIPMNQDTLGLMSAPPAPTPMPTYGSLPASSPPDFSPIPTFGSLPASSPPDFSPIYYGTSHIHMDGSSQTASPFAWPNWETCSPLPPDPSPTTYNLPTPPAPVDPLSTPQSRPHNCSREASATLTSLTVLDLDRIHALPLEQILRLSRDACDCLARILACPCARNPPVALLCASILSRALLLYHQAASATHSYPGDALTPTESLSPQGSVSSSVSSASVVPGIRSSFQVYDQRVHSALRMQLLLAEIKNAGCVVETFAALQGSGSGRDEGLWKCLSGWLRGELERVVDVTRAKVVDGC